MATDSTRTKADKEEKEGEEATAGAVSETGRTGATGTAEETREGHGAGKTGADADTDGDTGHTGAGEGDDVRDEAGDAATEAPGAEDTTTVKRAPGVGAGAGAVVSAALGLCSLTGNPLADMFRERESLIGQIKASSGAMDQIQALYGGPWHAAAMVNGLFALIAVIVGAVVLGTGGKRATPGSGARAWVRPVALAGLVLGVIGFVVAGGMVFDVFASAPQLPTSGSGAGS